MNILEKLWKKGIFRALPYSIWFNLRHLPLRQAIHLPILLYKAKVRGNGRFIIEGKIKPGMIRLGFYSIGIFPNAELQSKTAEKSGLKDELLSQTIHLCR